MLGLSKVWERTREIGGTEMDLKSARRNARKATSHRQRGAPGYRFGFHAAHAEECPGNSAAISTSQIISVDPAALRQVGTAQYAQCLAIVRDDERVCRRLMKPPPASAKRLHNAHYQSGEAIIRYGFHPRCGETVVIVTGRNRHGDEVALTIRQPDGTLAQLPIWMTEDRAEAMRVMTEIPRIALACLRRTASRT